MLYDLSVGDTVRLKSGSPWMRIDRLLLPQALCAWFDENHQRKDRWCEVDALEKLKLDEY